jgi:hypothetical protein
MRGRRAAQETGYVTYLTDVSIPELDGEAAPVTAEVRQFGATIPVRKYGNQFYVPLIDQSSDPQDILATDHLKRENWPDLAGAISQMLRPLMNDEGAKDYTAKYGHWAYQYMFTTMKGSDGGGHDAYVPEELVRTSSIREEERAKREHAARQAYQSCLIIDGVPYRPCNEPRYIAKMEWMHVQIDIDFDGIEHGKAFGSRKNEKCEPPRKVASFRLDRYDDMIDYLNSRIRENFKIIMWGNLQVDIQDMNALEYDDEANDLIRTAHWVVEKDYQSLLSASDDAIAAWAVLKKSVGLLKSADGLDMGDALTSALNDYLPVAMSSESIAAINDATDRFNMRPMCVTRKL